MLKSSKIEGKVTDHKLYKIFRNMWQRCYDKNKDNYYLYGQRGIYISSEWLDNPVSFIEWALENNWIEGKHIDRIDNNGPYSKENCRIVTPRENAYNKRNNVILTINGYTGTLYDHEKRSGISSKTIYKRYHELKWPEDRLLEPVNSGIKKERENCNIDNIILTINGKLASIREHSKISGIDSNTIYKRYTVYNWPEGRLLEPINKKNKPTTVIIDGFEGTFKEHGERNNIASNTIRERYVAGWSLDDLLKPVKTKLKK